MLPRAAALRYGQRPGVRAIDVGVAGRCRSGDAGAASGLVNVMQQVGGALGLSVLVTVFGTASRAAKHHVAAGGSVQSAHLRLRGRSRVLRSRADADVRWRLWPTCDRASAGSDDRAGRGVRELEPAACDR